MAENDIQFDPTEGGNGISVAQPQAPVTDPAKPEPDAATKALVSQWTARVKAAKKHWDKKVFERMKTCQRIAADGTSDKAWLTGEKYVAPILNRHINVSVASLYARNPKATAKRREKMMFQIWDGDPQSLTAALQAVSQPAPGVDPMTGAQVPGPPDPMAAAMLQEVQAAKQQNLMLDRMAKTLELLFSHYLGEQDANYKVQLKSAVRRAKVTAVAWAKLGFQRVLQPNPDVTEKIADVTSKIAQLQRLIEEASEGEIGPDDPDMAQLRLLLADLQDQSQMIAREGPVIGFPKGTEIIIDPKCRHLKTLTGAGWIAHEFKKTPEEVEELYKVDVKGSFTQYKGTTGEIIGGKTGDDDTAQVCLWEVQNKVTQQVFTICDGYPDFLKAPAEPDVKIERFWTLFPLVFNEVEDDEDAEGCIYPSSDVWAARHTQKDYNSAREYAREQRIAAQPRYVTPTSKFEDKDLQKIGNSAPHTVITMNALQPGDDITKLLMRVPVAGTDPNLNEVNSILSDMERIVGTQASTLGGGQSGDTTATEASIAEQSRGSTNSDNVDDLDDWLSAIARSMGQLMLLELSKETVVEIVGPGAVWPDVQMNREQIAKDLLLEIEAGSSGRPNRAAELSNMERGMPFIQMLPSVNPVPLAKKYLGLLDIDLEEGIVEGLPSINAMNAMISHPQPPAPGGDPTAQPDAQGPHGADNAPKPAGNESQGQAAYPAPHPGEQPANGAPI